MVDPHGGTLVERYIEGAELDRITDGARMLTLSERLVFDALMIGIGGFSPLEGFVSREDYEGILKNMRLADGALFAVPIVLPVDESTYGKVKEGEKVGLKKSDGAVIGMIEVSGKFRRDLEKEALSVYRTADKEHPGVAKINEEGPWALSGALSIVRERIDTGYGSDFLTPRRTREYFRSKGWNTVAAFQTRNPIHRAHEYLTKVALEMTDGLMIHPIVGELKAGDIPAETRMQCYKTLIDLYYNPERVLLNVLPMAMRYAGPREAIHHGIIRQNYGISHLIIGRDHAGVGSYYGTYDAQKIYDEIGENDLQIKPLKFEHSFFCVLCGQMVTAKTCGHDKSNHVFLSGTKVREKLRNGEDLPPEFTRKEISDILKGWASG